MADHDKVDDSLAQTEPAVISEIVRYIAGFLVTAGWLTIDSTTINAITTIVGALVSLGLTIWTRNKVTPVATPRNAEGEQLVTAPIPGSTPPTEGQ